MQRFRSGLHDPLHGDYRKVDMVEIRMSVCIENGTSDSSGCIQYDWKGYLSSMPRTRR